MRSIHSTSPSQLRLHANGVVNPAMHIEMCRLQRYKSSLLKSARFQLQLKELAELVMNLSSIRVIGEFLKPTEHSFTSSLPTTFCLLTPKSSPITPIWLTSSQNSLWLSLKTPQDSTFSACVLDTTGSICRSAQIRCPSLPALQPQQEASTCSRGSSRGKCLTQGKQQSQYISS